MNTCPESSTRSRNRVSEVETQATLREYRLSMVTLVNTSILPVAKDNVTKEWEVKRKLLETPDEHLLQSDTQTAMAAPHVMLRDDKTERGMTTVVEFIAGSFSPLPFCLHEAGQDYYHFTLTDAGRKRVVKEVYSPD